MIFFPFGRRRKRHLWLYMVYLLILAGGLIALWLLVPDETKQLIRETYFSRP